MRTTKLPRRHILRGALGGVAMQVALPPLEAMLGTHGDAFAAGEPLPTFFGVWFFGNGVRPEKWVPAATGADFPASPELAPLLDVARPWLTVLSGFDAKGDKYVHAGPASAVLTGTGLVHAEGDAGTVAGTSIDALVAAELGAGMPFRSLETGLYNFLGKGSAYWAISHSGPDKPNLPELDARIVYNRLFGAGSPGAARANAGTAAPVADATIGQRKSALDAVLEDCKRLTATVGAADRQRIEQHCESIRGIEQRLSSPAGGPVAGCRLPPGPTNITNDKAGRALYKSSTAFKEVNLTMSQLIAHALVCQLTRVFTHCFTNPAAHWVFDKSLNPSAGIPGSFHQLTHDETGDQPNVHRGVLFQMGCLADTLTVFKNTPFGAGNLLDHMAMMVTSDCAIGQKHVPTDMPFLIAGKAGGRLYGNRHVRGRGESVTRATLTAARAAGAKLAAFGVDGQRVTDPIGNVMV